MAPFMPDYAPFVIRRLGPDDLALFRALMGMFGEVFDERETYQGAPPGDGYVRELLGSASFFALAALQGNHIVGGLAAYELRKFERERSEIYIYDLAVLEEHRRRGIAESLIRQLQALAAVRGAWVIFVQADPPDAPAIALYTKLGVREDVLHFDIPVSRSNVALPDRPDEC